MLKEKRMKKNPIPKDLGRVLNEAQLLGLRKAEGFGWELKFIRRALFQDVVTVLLHPDTNKLGTLDEDGALNLQPNIVFRT